MNKVNANGRTSQEYREELREAKLHDKAMTYIIYELFHNERLEQPHVPPFELERYTLSNFKDYTWLHRALGGRDDSDHAECFTCNNDSVILQFQVLMAEGKFPNTRYAVIVLKSIDQPVKDGEMITFDERGIQSHYVEGYRTTEMPLLGRLMRAQRRNV